MFEGTKPEVSARDQQWWAYFDRRSRAELSPADLIAEARWRSVEPPESKLTGVDLHTFTFDPAQPLKLRADSGDRGLQLEIPKRPEGRGRVARC